MKTEAHDIHSTGGISRDTRDQTITFMDIVAELRKLIYVTPDIEYALKIALASYIGNRLSGDPIWIIIVSPPSTAKTELIVGLGDCKDVRMISTLTTKTFVSGYTGKSNASLLIQIGKFGIVLLKDLTSILQFPANDKREIFAQLREIYDGYYSKTFGTGDTIEWEGKIGIIAGCTPVIERDQAELQSLGERFLLCRILDVSSDKENEELALDKALEDPPVEESRILRCNFRDKVAKFTNQTLSLIKSRPDLHPEKCNENIKICSLFIAQARTAVLRHSYNREELLTEPYTEGSTRIVKQLKGILKGLMIIDGVTVPTDEHTKHLIRITLDNIPSRRKKIFDAIPLAGISLAQLEASLGYGSKNRGFRRQIEDLEMIGIVQTKKSGNRIIISPTEKFENFYKLKHDSE